jgi:long-chain acyl-CoA synthetase
MINKKITRPISLPDVLEYWAGIHPKKDAIISGDASCKYGELNQKVKSFSSTLVKLGIKPRDIVCCFLPKTPEFVITFLGTIRSNAIYAPANPTINDRALNQIIASILPSVIVLKLEDFEKISSMVTNTGRACQYIIVDADDFMGTNVYLWKDISEQSYDVDFHPLDLNDITYLNFTSGTTGNPKSATTSHNNIYWNAISAIGELQLNENDVHLCTFPSYLHPHEIIARPIYLGGTFVLSESSPASIIENLVNHSVTVMMSSPSIYQLLLQNFDQREIKNLTLKIAESGGAVTPSKLIKDFKESLNVNLIPVWGSTETTGAAIISLDNFTGIDNEMVLGKPCANYEVKIVDEFGNETKKGEAGELLIKGPGVVSRYWGVTESENSRFNNDWYHTQDLVREGPNRQLFFIGRIHDMIKTNGLKVYPSEIEKILLSDIRIEAVSVIGVTDDLRGEILRAVIVVKKNNNLTKRDVVKYCQERLEGYKIPRQIIFVDTLPLGANGKVDKKALKELQISKY